MDDTRSDAPTLPVSKWAGEHATPTVKAFHNAIRARVAKKLGSEERPWRDVVFDPGFALTADEFTEVEAELLATGYRFDHSAQISLTESPEKYKATVAAGTSVAKDRPEHSAADGDTVVGSGDNAMPFQADVEGTVRFVDTVEKVMEMLVEGVPAETIAVIEDAGGTLTAPILEGFKGVLCKGGTIKSHLGVLSREFRIPCLMAVELSDLVDGDRVRMECTKPPPETTSDAVRTGAHDRARIWKLAR